MDMTNLSDHYQYLFLGKVTGTLDSLESDELDTLLRNAEIRSAYEAFTKALPSNYVSNSFDHLNDPAYWKDIAKPYKKKRILLSWQRLTMAAAVLVLIIGAWYLLQPAKKEGITQHIAAQKKDFVQLKLSGGKLVDLSNTKGEIKEGTTEVVNTDKSLSYSSKDSMDYGINEVRVPIGMDYQVTLSDGSKIWMNSTTHLFFPTNFHPDSREITLSGEAYIEVARDSRRPFMVKLPNSSVQVLGTAFNVNTYDPGVTKVSLVSGSIQFSGGQTKLIIDPGDQVVYNADGGINKQFFDPKLVLSWKKGLYYFEEASLTEIATVIQRWFGANTIIDSRNLLNIKIAGVLNKNEPLENFLDDLKAIANIQTYFDKEGVLHFK